MTTSAVYDRPSLHRRRRFNTAPRDLFKALYGGDEYAFLYESLSGHGRLGRFSFLGGRPCAILTARGGDCTLQTAGQRHCTVGNPFDVLRATIAAPAGLPAVPAFSGGAVGYCAYDAVRLFERVSDTVEDGLGLPDLYLIYPGELVVFDHLSGDADILVYNDGARRIKEIEDVLANRATVAMPTEVPGDSTVGLSIGEPVPSIEKSEFLRAVRCAKEYIYSGDIFQVVLSQRFEFTPPADSFSLYDALCRTNPSPYMYYLQFGDLRVIGSSPETMVRLDGRLATVRPLAGTRPCTGDERLDERHEADLRADEKERAEHVMLVDLARNDLGRVCEYGSVQTVKLLEVERFARVMHLVSQVEGRLAPGRDAVDLFGAAFPAGTVSGAPKVRAMEIIDALERTRRGIYAGAIGYFGLNGNMDTCITIRTIVIHAGRGYVQSGAGIVADSDPQREYEETLHKAKAIVQAIADLRGAA